MSKEAMRARIEEALKSGEPDEIKLRVGVCLWGLGKVKGGVDLSNALIDELGLEKYGAQKGQPA
jgi:hypothetical protein